MRVYFVISEELESGGNPYGDPPEPPDWGCICQIVVATTAHKARWLAWRHDPASRHVTAAEMPNFRCFRLGDAFGFPRVMDLSEAASWWEKTTEKMTAPPPRGSSKSLPSERQRMDRALLGGDPSL